MRVWPMWYNKDRRGAVAAATNKKATPSRFWLGVARPMDGGRL